MQIMLFVDLVYFKETRMNDTVEKSMEILKSLMTTRKESNNHTSIKMHKIKCIPL